jgi:hypothetical protein
VTGLAECDLLKFNGGQNLVSRWVGEALTEGADLSVNDLGEGGQAFSQGTDHPTTWRAWTAGSADIYRTGSRIGPPETSPPT